MPQRNLTFGDLGARGTKGSELVARRLDSLVDFIATPITAPRGLLARLHYLTRTPRALSAARELGLTASDRTVKAWLSGTRRPTPANLQRIDAAYRALRRRNVARHLLQRLNADGGTRVEFHPLNQSAVENRYQRPISYRRMKVRRWDSIVAAWAADDALALDEVWTTHVLPDLGSQWGQYEYASSIGFGA